MQEYDNRDSGILYVEEQKKDENSPDFSGDCELVIPDAGGKTVKFKVWGRKKISKAGKKYIKLSFRLKEFHDRQKKKDGTTSAPW